MIPILAAEFFESHSAQSSSPLARPHSALSTTASARQNQERIAASVRAGKRAEEGIATARENTSSAGDIFSWSDKTLADRYQFVEEIGFGNWGSVWRCRSKQEPSGSNSTVAIKLVHRTKDPSAAARVKSLWSEFKTVRAVSRVEAHPNIVRFDSFVITPGYALIAMPQYDRLIPVKLPEKVATGYFAQLVSAVDFLHSNGCTHNDIKPVNILLHNDRPIIVDFGFAQHYNSTSTARFIDAQSWGTPEYLSPERARGSVHDSRLSDIWSLGVTFYEIVTGRTPFERTDSEEFLSKDALQVYYDRTLSGIFYGTITVSPAFEDLIHKMVQPSTLRRLPVVGMALRHRFFNGLDLTPPRSVTYSTNAAQQSPSASGDRKSTRIGRIGTPSKRTGNDEIKIYRDPFGDSNSPGSKSTSSNSSKNSPRVLGERRINNVESPLRAPTSSRIPVRKISPVSTPTKIRTPAKKNQTPPTLAAQRPPTSPSPFVLERAPVPAAPAFQPLVLKKKRQIKVAKEDDEIEALSESVSKTATPDILRASTQSRSSSSIGLGRPSSGLGFNIKDSIKRSPSVFFRRLSVSISSATRKKLSTSSSTTSSVDDQSALAESSIGAVAVATVASSFADEIQRQHQRERLDSFSQQIQAIIDTRSPARNSPNHPQIKRSAPAALVTTLEQQPILSRVEVKKFSERVKQELALAPRRVATTIDTSPNRPVSPLRPGTSHSIGRTRAPSRIATRSSYTAVKIRPSLAPSFISTNGSPESRKSIEVVATPLNPKFLKGHKRIPTAIRNVPAILLSESADERSSGEWSLRSQTRSTRSPSPAPAPVLFSEGRVLPTFVADVDTSSDDYTGVINEENEQLTMTYEASKAPAVVTPPRKTLPFEISTPSSIRRLDQRLPATPSLAGSINGSTKSQVKIEKKKSGKENAFAGKLKKTFTKFLR